MLLTAAAPGGSQPFNTDQKQIFPFSNVIIGRYNQLIEDVWTITN